MDRMNHMGLGEIATAKINVIIRLCNEFCKQVIGDHFRW